jgi:hypothetical protein
MVIDKVRGLKFCWFFQAILEVTEALVNMGDVLGELWPLDNTARILLRILVHYNYGASVRSSEADRCKISVEFCDTVLRENAIRALVKDPPLSFRQAKERWADVTERYASNVFAARGQVTANNGRQAGGGGQFGGGQFGSGGQAGGSGQNVRGFGGGAAAGGGGNGGGRAGFQNRNRNARVFVGGKSYPVCFDYNRASCNRKPAGCGCEDAKGVVFAHACNYWNFTTAKFCLASHTRVGNH